MREKWKSRGGERTYVLVAQGFETDWKILRFGVPQARLAELAQAPRKHLAVLCVDTLVNSYFLYYLNNTEKSLIN
jgi:hypothetical protein